MDDTTESLARALSARPRTLVVTGAGISVASGIPTFRGTDEGAVWKESDVVMATAEFFRRDPLTSWQWYMQRFDRYRHSQPNPAHQALASLEERLGDDFLLVTQNIDGLHRAAGSRRLIEIHGSAHQWRCSAHGCRLGAPRGLVPSGPPFRPAHSDELPKCPECQSLLRPHVLWFDEFYSDHASYRFEEAIDWATRADLLLFVGTSFSVGITDALLREGLLRGAALFSIDPGATPPPYPGIETVPHAAEDVLPALLESL